MLEGKGICLKERALIQFPDGEMRSAQIWQHTIGVRGIYAIAPDEEGILTPYALKPVWIVQVDDEGEPMWQGMGANSWLVELWFRLKVAWSKGRTKRFRRLNLA